MSPILDGQPVGRPLPDWSRRAAPERVSLEGRSAWVAPLGPAHDDPLVDALTADGDARRFTYLGSGPSGDPQSLATWLAELRARDDVVPFALGRRGCEAEGTASLMRIDPENGSVEIGSIVYGPTLARTTAATEAMYLLASYVFDDLGYRRYEWKCDSLNSPSRRAAERLGFRYEGTWRNALVYKGRNRDTSWYSITDDEWPAVKVALERWLDPSNFADGRQLRRLAELHGPGDAS